MRSLVNGGGLEMPEDVCSQDRNALYHAIVGGPTPAHKEVVMLLLSQRNITLEDTWLTAEELGPRGDEELEGSRWVDLVRDLHSDVRDGATGGVLYERYKRRKVSPLSSKLLLADDLQTSRGVVLKRLSDQGKWKREVEVLNQLASRGLGTAPQRYDAFPDTATGDFVIVLEEGAAAPLEGVNSAGEIITIGVVQTLLKCVSALHDLGVVHCDLKPSAFLKFPDRDGNWRLASYDSVLYAGKILDAPSLIGQRTAYCSPEVAQARLDGSVKQPIKEAIDVWSLGLILYEIFAQEPLMRGCLPIEFSSGHQVTAEKDLGEAGAGGESYLRWLVGGGAEQLVQKLEDNVGQLLSESQRGLLRHMLRVDPGERRSLSELLRLPLFNAPTSKITLFHVFLLRSRKAGLDLDREMRHTSQALALGDREFCPAARFPDDIYQKLEGANAIRPRVLAFAGHGYEDGSVEVDKQLNVKSSRISRDTFVEFVGECMQKCAQSIELIFLNFCLSTALAEAIRDRFPALTVVFWRTAVCDPAATAFAQGLFSAVANSSPAKAYLAGAEAFGAANYTQGDPYASGGHLPPNQLVHGVHGILEPALTKEAEALKAAAEEKEKAAAKKKEMVKAMAKAKAAAAEAAAAAAAAAAAKATAKAAEAAEADAALHPHTVAGHVTEASAISSTSHEQQVGPRLGGTVTESAAYV